MKIIMINGSPRTNGSTARIMHIMQKQLLKKEDTEVDFYNLSELNFNFCKGCCSCFQTAKCIMNDDLEKLSQALALSDGIIIGSPTYASNVSGQLKTLIDRGHLIIEQGLHKKYAIGIITSENYGASAAARILKNVFTYSGASVTTMIKHKLPFTNSPHLPPKATKKFEAKADQFHEDIKTKHQYFLQKIIHNLIFHIGIKPFVLKKGNKYQGVINRWKSLSILD